MKKTTSKSYALRIDGPLVKPLQELKKQNRRSLNAEINAALEAWVAVAHAQKATAKAASAGKSAKVSRTKPVPAEAATAEAAQTEAPQADAVEAEPVRLQATQPETASSQSRPKRPARRKSASAPAALQADTTPEPDSAPVA